PVDYHPPVNVAAAAAAAAARGAGGSSGGVASGGAAGASSLLPHTTTTTTTTTTRRRCAVPGCNTLSGCSHSRCRRCRCCCCTTTSTTTAAPPPPPPPLLLLSPPPQQQQQQQKQPRYLRRTVPHYESPPQGDQVHAALLSRQVNGADALPRHCVGVGAVLQQRGADVHLVLLGSDVERRAGHVLVALAGGQVQRGIARGGGGVGCGPVLQQLLHDGVDDVLVAHERCHMDGRQARLQGAGGERTQAAHKNTVMKNHRDRINSDT
ncbi:hypothetical protein CRUP_021557, partial [Coryphaenoides rupestris]